MRFAPHLLTAHRSPLTAYRSPSGVPGRRRYDLHQGAVEFAQGKISGCRAAILPESHHNELVGRNDRRALATGALHRIGAPRDRVPAVAVHPEEPAAIDRAAVGQPGRRDGAHVLDVAFGQEALAVPDAILE